MAEKKETKTKPVDVLDTEALKERGNETMEVPASALLSLIEQTKELTGRLNRIEGAPARVTSRGDKSSVIEVATLENKLVLGWTDKGAYEVFNPTKRTYDLYMDILVEGEKEAVTMPYREFFKRIEVHPVKVLKEESEEIVKIDGTVERKSIAKSGYATVGTGESVDMEVVSVERTFTVRHPLEDREVKIGEKYVNLRKW